MTYKHGEWNAECDVCGMQYKSSELKKRWDGLYVCEKDFETEHPSDKFKFPKEKEGIEWVRGDDTDTTPDPVDEVLGEELVSSDSFTDISAWSVLTQEGTASVSNGTIVLSSFRGVLTSIDTPQSVVGTKYTWSVTIDSFGGVGLTGIQYGTGINQVAGSSIPTMWTGGFGYPGTFTGIGTTTDIKSLTVSIGLVAGDLVISDISIKQYYADVLTDVPTGTFDGSL